MTSFDAVWKTLVIPGEYDAMDALDKERWRGAVEAAYRAGVSDATERAAKLFDVPAGIHGEAEDWSREAAALIRGTT